MGRPRVGGTNDDGVLGNNPMLVTAPVQVTALGTDAVELATGYLSSCARKSDGTLWCWGYNLDGQLGIGTRATSTTPVQVTSLGTSVTSIGFGSDFACARTSNGMVSCWGRNDGNVLTASVTEATTPQQISGISGAASVAAGGGYHACTLQADGAVWCWGDNTNGQAGNTTQSSPAAPAQVSTLGTGAVTALAVGQSHTCVRKSDGSAACWGDNYYGQLGDGSMTTRTAPVPVGVLGTNVASLSAGSAATCAVKTDNTAWCWGTYYGATPVELTALGANVAQVAMASYFACARKSDGTLWCWGNDPTHIGVSTTWDVPVQVTSLGTSVAELYQTQGSHLCVRKTDGSTWCWGLNSQGGLGIGSMTDSYLPVSTVSTCP